MRTLLLIFGTLLLGVLIAYLSHNRHANTRNGDSTLIAGGWLSSLIHRGALRNYSHKISNASVSKHELIDYIEKGGSLNGYSRYNKVRDFFVGKLQYSVLVHFIHARYEHQTEPPKNRLELLRLLLVAGANPNYLVGTSSYFKNDYLSPVLQACATDDVEALALLYEFGGDLESTEETYLKEQGPCLAATSNTQTLDWLKSHSANLSYRDSSGKNLLHLAVLSYDPISKIQWLIEQGVPANTQDDSGTTLLDDIERLQASWKHSLTTHEPAASNESIDSADAKVNANVTLYQEKISYLTNVLKQLDAHR